VKQQAVELREAQRNIPSDKGQELVEFALILPILLVLLLGVIEFGRLIFIYNTIANAAREGARYAIVDPANASSAAATCSTHPGGAAGQACDFATGVNPAQLSVEVARSGFAVQVNVSCNVDLLVKPLIQAFWPQGSPGSSGTVTLAAAATMQREQ